MKAKFLSAEVELAPKEGFTSVTFEVQYSPFTIVQIIGLTETKEAEIFLGSQIEDFEIIGYQAKRAFWITYDNSGEPQEVAYNEDKDPEICLLDIVNKNNRCCPFMVPKEAIYVLFPKGEENDKTELNEIFDKLAVEEEPIQNKNQCF